LALMQSALARPRNVATYGEPDAAALAAAYAYGLARNHPFQDGNKRTAFVVALVFLLVNGWVFTAPDAEAVAVILNLAAGEIDEKGLADWFRVHIRRT
jgi:death-on-curing protein